MPNFLANSACFIFFSLSIVFISILSTVGIVLVFKTLVKMKNDDNIAREIGERLKRFRLDVLSRDDSSQRKISLGYMAQKFNEDHPDDPIGRGQIKQQERSPQWEYLFWLKRRYRLNLRWAIENKGNPIEI